MAIGTVVSVGARGPLGLSSLQMAMNIRAAKLEPRRSSFRDKRAQPVALCMTGGLSAESHGYERMLSLAVPALREAMAAVTQPDLALVLALPERDRPDNDERFDGAIVSELGQQSGLTLDVARSSVVRAGHAGGALALEQARALLSAGAAGVVVGGVDSYHHPKVVRWLDEACRLGALDAEDGFLPSEGAAFFVLQADAARAALGSAVPLARLTHAIAEREETVLSGEPNLAQAMTRALRTIELECGLLPWALCDVNGERHRVREWQMLLLRELFAPSMVEHRVPTDLGDVGAASGATFVAHACALWRTGCAPSSSCVVALHSEGAERGVLRLEEVP